MAKFIVEETLNGLKYPSTFVKPRGRRKMIANIAALILFLILAIHMQDASCFVHFLIWLPVIILTVVIDEYVSRMCALFEEWKHIQSRYENKIMVLLSDVLYLSSQTLFYLFVSLISLISYFLLSETNFYEVFFPKIVFGLAIMAARRIFQLEEGPLNESLGIDALKCLDYGSGMAFSFFYGYLRITLPHTGHQFDKGIKEILQDYEARNSIKFDFYKLFILVPVSLNCPPSLENDFSPSVAVCKELESKELDRAGVRNRNYKNSVYKIKTGKNKIKYVAAEYATPLKTLHEVMNANSPYSNDFRKHCKQIISNFFHTLRDLVRNDPDCCNVCEIVYYEDKNEMGQFRDVGLIILQKMKELVKKSQ